MTEASRPEGGPPSSQTEPDEAAVAQNAAATDGAKISDEVSVEATLTVDELCIERRIRGRFRTLVSDVTFAIPKGCNGFIVGQSGIGKSLVLRSILGLLGNGDWRLSGSIALRGGRCLLDDGQYNEEAFATVRGKHLAAIFQEPTTSLHPSLSVGRQLLEVIAGGDRKQRERRALDALERMRIGASRYPDVLRRYPHQFSQGERQRICIALALCVGGLVLADEPTASLDPATAEEVSRDLVALRDGEGLDGLIFVTHQPKLIELLGRPSDVVLALDRASEGDPARGRVSRLGSRDIRDLHPCFRLDLPDPGPRAAREDAAPALEVKGVRQTLRRGFFRPPQTILRGADLTLAPGEMVGVIGASGSGKTTLARAVMRLVGGTSGEIWLSRPGPADGETHDDLVRLQPDGSTFDTAAMHAARCAIQYISQEAATVFNPAMRIGEILDETLQLDGFSSNGSELDELARRLEFGEGWQDVSGLVDRYPSELSGGQKQRLVLLRAMLRRPRVIVADEPFTGQDLATTSEILRLMDEARRHYDVAILLISHDQELLFHVCNRLYRLVDGRLSEMPTNEESEHDARRHTADVV